MNVSISTLNCGQLQQPASEIQSLVEASIEAFTQPDIIVLGVQEVAPLINTLLGTVSPFKLPLYKGIGAALQQNFPQTTFRLQAEQWTGGIGLLVYTRFGNARATTSFTNFGNFWSSAKGAVAARVTIGGASYTFVSTHLPAHQGIDFVQKRNQAYEILANGLQLEGHSIYDTNHLFVLGDLNYRATTVKGGSEERESLLQEFDFEQQDELTIEKQQGKVLWSLEEYPINFEPTFKYYVDTQSYNYKRTPSWTDRILYSDSRATVKSYQSLQSYKSSDHRPVYLSVVVQPAARVAEVQVPSATVCPRELALVIDKTLGSGVFLATTKIGWGILLLMVVGAWLLL